MKIRGPCFIPLNHKHKNIGFHEDDLTIRGKILKKLYMLKPN